MLACAAFARGLPVWFDPGEVSGQLTLFCFLFALHDALVKPMPGHPTSADEFKLGESLKFQNGDSLTAEDGKFR